MNVKQLIGLAAIVLGGMTSCSNILEEDGVSNTITKGETGELRLNIVTDSSLKVETKATVSTTVPNTDFTIYGTPQGEAESWLGDYKETMTVPAKIYTQLRVVCDKMEGKLFGFNVPHYEGTTEESTTIPVTAGGAPATPPTIHPTLKNSVVSVNIEDLTGLVTIDELRLRNKEENSEYLDLINESGKLKEGEVFVHEDKSNIEIHIKGHLTNEPSRTFEATHPIKESDQGTTVAAKQYKVTYNLSAVNGSLNLTIDINYDIEEVPIPVDPINPYPTE